jgi:hypothetical protein
LDLSSNQIGDEGVRYLSRMLGLNNLDLSYNRNTSKKTCARSCQCRCTIF